jgi:hypothetical protein
MDLVKLIIFSHSDYSYLWKIIEEYFSKINGIKCVFISNNTTIEKPKGFEQYIEYNSNDCYAKRWINILPLIDSKYIIVVHDVSIIVNYESDKMIKLINVVNKYNIDRLSLNVFKADNYIEDNGIKICNLNSTNIQSKTFIPFDVCSAIWNKESFLKLWLHFPSETYHSSEVNQLLQLFCKNNLNCFGLQYNNNEKIYYCLGRPYHNLFKILHITIKGEITYPLDVYMDMKDDFLYIFEKYSLKDKININHNYHFILHQQYKY